MPKIRTDAGQMPTVQVRVSEAIYRKLREIAIRHDVTLAQAMDFLFDEVRIKAEEKARTLEQKLEKLQSELEKVKKERDSYAREIRELEDAFAEYGDKRTKGAGRKAKRK